MRIHCLPFDLNVASVFNKSTDMSVIDYIAQGCKNTLLTETFDAQAQLCTAAFAKSVLLICC